VPRAAARWERAAASAAGAWCSREGQPEAAFSRMVLAKVSSDAP
jgi:hypothetical protein